MVASLGLDEFRKLDSPIEPLAFTGAWAYALCDLNPARHGDYSRICQLSADDGNPPLYAILLHEVIYFTGCQHQIWQGTSLNFVICLLTLPLLYSCARMLCPQPEHQTVALLAPCFFVGSVLTLEMFLFTRMYILLVFFCVVLVFLWLQLTLQGRSFRWRSILFVLWSFTVTLGCLTHYYFLVWTTCLSFAGLFMLERRQWKSWFLLSISSFAGFGMALLIFPPMFRNIFESEGSRGSQSNLLEILAGNFRPVFSSLGAFWQHTTEQLLYPEILLLGFGLTVARVWQWPQEWRRGLALTLTSVGFWLVISLTAPLQAARYLSPLLAIVPLLVVVVITSVQRRWRLGLTSLTLAIFACRIFTTRLHHAFQDQQSAFHHPRQTGVIFVNTKSFWRIWNLFRKVNPTQNYIFLTERHLGSRQLQLMLPLAPDNFLKLVRQEAPLYWAGELNEEVFVKGGLSGDGPQVLVLF